MALVAERARSGKMKQKRRTWVHRLRMRGPLALLWKEIFLQPRSMMALLIIFAVAAIGFSLMPAMMRFKDDAASVSTGYIFLLMQGMVVLMVASGVAQTGSIETLRRVDLLKAMPFPPSVIIFAEVVSKVLLPIVCCWFGGLVAGILQPELWPFVLASAVFAPFLAVLFSSSVYLVTILFPDVEDHTQKQFRGLMTLLAFAISGFIPVVALGGLLFLRLSPPLAALLASVPALGIAALIAGFTGQMYATYNPSE